MNLKGIIFDLDGVIVFTDKFHYKAWKKIADEIGVYFDEKINNQLRGVSRMDSLNIILKNSSKEIGEEEKTALAERKNNYYRELLKTMTPADVSDEVRSTLKELKKKGYLLSIGSSSKNARFILDKVELTNYFDAISDGNNITKSKPDPEVFLKASKFLGLDAWECAVVEDAYAGIDAAKAGNMCAIAIGDATSYEKADHKITFFSDLLKLF